MIPFGTRRNITIASGSECGVVMRWLPMPATLEDRSLFRTPPCRSLPTSNTTSSLATTTRTSRVCGGWRSSCGRTGGWTTLNPQLSTCPHRRPPRPGPCGPPVHPAPARRRCSPGYALPLQGCGLRRGIRGGVCGSAGHPTRHAAAEAAERGVEQGKDRAQRREDCVMSIGKTKKQCEERDAHFFR